MTQDPTTCSLHWEGQPWSSAAASEARERLGRDGAVMIRGAGVGSADIDSRFTFNDFANDAGRVLAVAAEGFEHGFDAFGCDRHQKPAAGLRVAEQLLVALVERGDRLTVNG